MFRMVKSTYTSFYIWPTYFFQLIQLVKKVICKAQSIA